MSQILSAILLGLMIGFSAQGITTAIDCNSGIAAACEMRKASIFYEAPK